MNKLYPNSVFQGILGYGSYIGRNSRINARIGKFTSIAPYVHINAGIHPYQKPFATTSPAFYSLAKQNGETFAVKQTFDEFVLADKKDKLAVIIGSDCWIGQGAFINGGVTIGDGAIVLAHAVVTKDIPPYAIVGGVPAKIIKYRYEPQDIAFLLEIKWWNKNIEWLKVHTEEICDFKKLYKLFPETNLH